MQYLVNYIDRFSYCKLFIKLQKILNKKEGNKDGI